mgnify:FL=1
MEILNLHKAPKVPFDLNGHILCKHKNLEIVHLTLKPGERIEKHVNPNDVIFYVLEGKALLETVNERILVNKDDVVKVEAGRERGFDNISVSLFKVMVIKFLPE